MRDVLRDFWIGERKWGNKNHFARSRGARSSCCGYGVLPSCKAFPAGVLAHITTQRSPTTRLTQQQFELRLAY